MTGISYGGLLKKQEKPTNLNSPVQGGLRYVPLPLPRPRTLDLGVCLPTYLGNISPLVLSLVGDEFVYHI
jgi:hypothetical protein